MPPENLSEYSGSTHDTKQATVLATMGLAWQFPAYFITYDEDHPKSSGGIVHFNFQSNAENSFRDLLAAYDAGTADVELDVWLEAQKQDDSQRAVSGVIAELEPLLNKAIIVYGRRFLENYRTLIKYLKTECPEIAHTKGSPVYNREGDIVARQDIQIRRLPRASK